MNRRFRTMLLITGVILLSQWLPLKSVRADDMDANSIFHLSIEELMEIRVVTAGRQPERIADIPASIVIITREEIERYGYQTLAEILENIPGLFMINDFSPYGINYGVRGFWSGVPNDNMMIFVNGVNQVTDFQSNYPLDAINVPVETIDRIEVVRGPMSVIYGSGAFYGAINIISNDTNQDEMNSVASVSYGTSDTKRAVARLCANDDNIKITVNAGYYDTYGLDIPLTDLTSNPMVSLPDGTEIPYLMSVGLDESSTTGGTLERSNKYFNISARFNHFIVDASYNESENEIYFIMPSPDEGTLSRNVKSIISITYRNQISTQLSIEEKLQYTQNRAWGKYDFFFEDFYGIEQVETNAYEIESNVFYEVSHNLDLTVGLNYRSILRAYDNYDLPGLNLVNNYLHLADDDDIQTAAIFTQINYVPHPDLRLVAGIRLEKLFKYGIIGESGAGTDTHYKIEGEYHEDELEVIPRFAILYSLNDQNIFKFLYGRATNRPSFFQNTKNTLDPYHDNLEPESIETYEINYIASFLPSININCSLFRNTLDNLITRVVLFDDNNNYQSWSANAGKMITNGVELTAQTCPFEDLWFEISATYQETTDEREGYGDIDVAYSPNILGYLKSSYFLNDRYSIALTGTYVGEMETFWDETIRNTDGTYGNRIGRKVDGYVNLGMNFRAENLFSRNMYANLRISNVLDEEIYYPTFTLNSWADKGTVGAGRTLLFTLGWEF